ncbi:alpha/beta hydrolase [Pollutimonas sp. H1-120]|uniref:alpha/beta fold hydrolase n=1 Tax=Pollutimonas sp. H1-120 TaxID=3148824 RepID=UPI003B5203AC
MPYITTSDNIRAYYDFEGSGPALIMLHGASQDSLSWQYNVEFFARHYSVYALDLPGHGKSGMPADGPNRRSDDNARYLISVMDALSLESAVLMGHSMGGGIVARAATMEKSRVQGLVLVDGASVNVVKSSGYNPKILEMARINPGDWFEVTFRTLMGSATLAERAEEIVTDARRCIPAVAFADISAFGSFRMEHILDDIQCPTVIVGGSEDWSVPPESARAVEKTLRQRNVPVEYLEWEGVGHFPQAECPSTFNVETLAAMKRLGL